MSYLDEPLSELRQHAINGWVAYAAKQMPRETAERMMNEYEERVRLDERLSMKLAAHHARNA